MNMIRCEDIKEEDNKDQVIEEETKHNTYPVQATESNIGQGTMNFVLHES